MLVHLHRSRHRPVWVVPGVTRRWSIRDLHRGKGTGLVRTWLVRGVRRRGSVLALHRGKGKGIGLVRGNGHACAQCQDGALLRRIVQAPVLPTPHHRQRLVPAIPPRLRVQTDVAAVSEAHQEIATVVAPIGVPSADPHECELRHMRAREERLGARAVGQVARPIEQPAVRQVVQVLLATRGLAKHVNLALPLFRTVPAWASVSRSVGRAPDRTGGRFGRWVGR